MKKQIDLLKFVYEIYAPKVRRFFKRKNKTYAGSTDRRYAITGVSVVDQLGTDLDENFQKMCAGVVKQWPDVYDSDTVNQYLIDKKLFSKRDVVRNFVDPSALIATYVTDRALDQSGVDRNLTDIPVITASLHAGGIAFDRVARKYHDVAVKHGCEYEEAHDVAPVRWSPMQLLSTGHEFASAHMAQMFDFTGPNFNISSTCSSSIQAIEAAAAFLDQGAPYAVVTSTDAMANNKPSRTFFEGIGAASPSGNCLPYDEKRDGLMLGDAAVCFILETLENAEARGAKIYGIIEGWGNANDAEHPASPSPKGIGCANAYKKAFAMADVKPSDIGYINAHGTATSVGDPIEIDVMKKYFKKGLPMVSHKGNIGHCMGACGAIEIAYGLKTLETGVIPGNGNLENPIDDYFDLVPHQETRLKPMKYFIKNSFGFGGRASAIILSKGNV